jgi:hypothetical protein
MWRRMNATAANLFERVLPPQTGHIAAVAA